MAWSRFLAFSAYLLRNWHSETIMTSCPERTRSQQQHTSAFLYLNILSELVGVTRRHGLVTTTLQHRHTKCFWAGNRTERLPRLCCGQSTVSRHLGSLACRPGIRAGHVTENYSPVWRVETSFGEKKKSHFCPRLVRAMSLTHVSKC